MKKIRKTKSGFHYPAGTIGSLKGDSMACIKYLNALNKSTRRNRSKERFLNDIFQKIT